MSASANAKSTGGNLWFDESRLGQIQMLIAWSMLQRTDSQNLRHTHIDRRAHPAEDARKWFLGFYVIACTVSALLRLSPW